MKFCNLKSAIDSDNQSIGMSSLNHRLNNCSDFRSKRHFSDEQLSILGTMHNMYVIDGLAMLRGSGRNIDSNAIVSAAVQMYVPGPILGISREDWRHHLLASMDEIGKRVNGYSNLNQNNSQETAFCEEILRETSNILNLPTFYIAMDNIAGRAKSQLYGLSLDTVLGTVSVAKSSAYLWAPVQMGGYGLFDSLFNPPPNGGGTAARWNWGGALKGDVAGSMGYFGGVIGDALITGAAWVPGANAVILGGWAIAAGIGSIGGGFGIY